MNEVLSIVEYLTAYKLDYEMSQADLYGNSGQYTVYPTSEEELSEIFAFVHKYQFTVNIQGAGSKRGYGGLIDQADLLISMEKFTGIVEHQSGDMTLTVKAGTKLEDVQRYLEDFNQKLALDPFMPHVSTIGGVIASNDSGPKRLNYGSARDAVIGLRVVYPDGKVIRTGGKVVKNVAGYDMNKLFISSMGTLGVITEVTVKLRPLAKSTATCIISFQGEDRNTIYSFTRNLLNNSIEPISCELLDPIVSYKISGINKLSLLISFEDVEKSVEYQIKYIQSLIEEEMNLIVLRNSEEKQLWDRLYQLPIDKEAEHNNGEKLFAVAKIGTINLNVIDILLKVMEIRRNTNIDIYTHGGVGHGLMQLYIKGEEREMIETLTKMREVTNENGGYCIIKHLPLAQRLVFDTWGETKGAHYLLEGIKTKVDPKKILNRKRYVGGI
ncbi:FAD-binding oxidoreductase [Cytobacillus kochii]|uniref:FAD-binding oxidoreductase n=1 Tax=Cytobacillus kochii TaxID=859143 RepID=UPI001CD7C7AE|nr:FAD-binding oxidoreductase [Cytobacillus kochii]MCA1028266.1 FAD-binding oxidoreductase [Cytobacillus kochii]